MNDPQRLALFLGACIPVRLCLAYVAHRFPHPLFRVLALLVAGRWAAVGTFGTHGVFGGVAWWDSLRPLHALLFLGYAMSGSAEWLAADAVFGLAMGVARHFGAF